MDKQRFGNALRIAWSAHSGQKRKYNSRPYIEHPMRVALTLARIGASDDACLAGLLHDVAEDAEEPLRSHVFQEIATNVGTDIAVMVYWLTNIRRVGSRPERKAADIARLASAPSDVRIVKAVDRADNVREAKETSDGFSFYSETYRRESMLLLDALFPQVWTSEEDKAYKLLASALEIPGAR